MPVESTLQFQQVLMDVKIEDIRLCQYPGMNHDDPVVGESRQFCLHVKLVNNRAAHTAYR